MRLFGPVRHQPAEHQDTHAGGYSGRRSRRKTGGPIYAACCRSRFPDFLQKVLIPKHSADFGART